MDLPLLNHSTLPNLAALVLEHNSEKLTRCMLAFAKNKEGDRYKDRVYILANERTLPLYKALTGVADLRTIYDPEQHDYMRMGGSTFLFDDCFADRDWMRDGKLNMAISYPRTLELTSVFGFRALPLMPPRMYWNLDMVCIGSNLPEEERTRIYKAFFLYLVSYETFCDLLETYTKENGFLVLRREGIDDRLYRASII